VTSTLQIVNKLKKFRYIFMDNSFNVPIFKKIDTAEQHYVEILPVYIELHPDLS